MRLTKIKLAGFKSFVDPTTIYIPSKLVGVVGPNGCGKSNIIDAVRWVMGESSAKHLRGDSMADVIFNGSSARKPVGHASIELAFDNSEGKLVGEYAGYNEIAIRRQVSRDGTSTYFLNGTRCRRRDITGIFLGTGLGPRSYSIIEQGMISRLIEAKPEDLRVFLEEAAGISKYKERRRETENRIRHTRENLDRLNDLLEEIDKQLEKLKLAVTARSSSVSWRRPWRPNWPHSALSRPSWRNFAKNWSSPTSPSIRYRATITGSVPTWRASNRRSSTAGSHVSSSYRSCSGRSRHWGKSASTSSVTAAGLNRWCRTSAPSSRNC
jgi:energy-coupling factor transporter ATP-binding protein EcfA2